VNAVLQEKEIERDDVDVALEAWARWAKQAFSGLGWSPTNIIARIIEYGLLGAIRSATGGAKIVEVDSVCEIVDQAIGRLPEGERRVVVVFYTKWWPREVSAQKCGVTETNFRQLLHRGRRSVKDYLAGRFLRYHDFPPSM
jgi:DNA-directed RNA polymerase specialized sigma subunit